MKSIYGIFFFLISTLFSTACLARDTIQNENILDPENDPHFNLIFGISPFDGILGLEYQNGGHSFGIGAPIHLSYRYYFDPYRDSKFWGIYVGSYTIDDYNEREDGILFREY